MSPVSKFMNGQEADQTDPDRHVIDVRAHLPLYAPDVISREADKKSPAFLLAAAAVGLFPHTPLASRTDTLFEKRAYTIRCARPEDLPALENLEAACWARGLKSASSALEKRVGQYPEGQLVIVTHERVAGVIYSQRIKEVAAIRTTPFHSMETIFAETGPVIQLLSINILPEMQEKKWGDQLLEFMLQYCALLDGIESVVAVTRCKNYGKSTPLPLADYIHTRNEQGHLCDPILRFHELHGARIEGLIPNYRSADTQNEGCGVLVSYDIHHRSRNELRIDKIPVDASNADCLCGMSGEDFIETAIRECLGEEKSPAFSFERPLLEMGLDSADLLALTEKLSHGFQLALAPAFFFQYNTARKILSYLNRQPAAAAGAPAGKTDTGCLPGRERAATAVSIRENTDASRDMAIIGMACRLPGGIDTPAQLWDCLTAGRSVIRTLPAGRWQWPGGIDPSHTHPGIDQGGFLDHIDRFDAPFFRISPKEAETMDPQQRLLLELSWETLEDAGYSPDRLRESPTGVFIGAGTSDYALLLEQYRTDVDAHWGTGNSMAVLANRISYFYDLRGPSLLIDTACSSSLVALHKAVQSLHSGESHTCLVGGVNVICHPAPTISYYKAGMLARDGRCRTFDQAAGGYVRAEGAAMLLIKPLARAVADHDPIHAVITGTACNHGGQAGGLTVPNPRQQAALLQQAWRAAGIGPETLGYIEAHGTGTALGDPIEIRGLKAAFSADGAGAAVESRTCGLGSIKTNLGHLEAAAGIVGLMKVVLCMRHRELVASINFDTLNPQIELTGTPFFIVDRRQPWSPAGNPGVRRAGVSSFGSGGGNAHAVLEEYRERPVPADGSPIPPLVVLSATDPERLQAYAARLLAYFDTRADETIRLAAVAYTLQRRQAMAERIAFFVDSPADLKEKLERLARGTGGIPDSYRGNQRQEPELARLFLLNEDIRAVLNRWIGEGKIGKVAKLWAGGVSVNWERFYDTGDRSAGCPPRLHLPPYPFSDRRYWIARPPAGLARDAARFFQSRLRKTASDSGDARFTIRFTGQEFFLRDHVVTGRKILPGVVYLEMARAAMTRIDRAPAHQHLRLKNVTWIQPVSLRDEALSVHLALHGEANGQTVYKIHGTSPGNDPVVYNQGRAFWDESAAPSRLDLDDVRRQCGHHVLTPEHCYAAFSRMQIDYGPGHRGIAALHAGRDQVLAKLSLPPAVADTRDQFFLHPSLLDAALQAVILLASGSHEPGSDRAVRRPLLPFALEEMAIIAPCTGRLWAWIRYADGSRAGDPVPKFHVSLCDAEGKRCVTLKGFSLRAPGREIRPQPDRTPPTGNILLMPVWQPQSPMKPVPASEERLVCLGVPDEGKAAVQAACSDPIFVEIPPHESISAMADRLTALGSVDHIMWVAPGFPREDAFSETILDAQHQGVLFVFKLLKALISLGYGKKKLAWTLVTARSRDVRKEDPLNPAHAGIHGLMGSVAKEYPGWPIRMVDLEEDSPWPLPDVFSLPADGRGETWAWRDGEWLRRELVRVSEFPVTGPVYQPGGVYVVIGGAGAIGEAWSRAVIAGYQARVIWIGRRPKDGAIQKKLDALAALGPAPVYIAADAANLDSLQKAYASIKETHSEINGVVHAAMVLADQPLAHMTTEEFQRVYAAKVDTSVRMAQVFQAESLDFALFFSSLIVFVPNPEESHYAAGCQFQDAFAHQLDRQWACPVKVVHWGYWENTRDLVSRDYLARLLAVGVGFIAPTEAMGTLDMLLTGPLGQLALMKTTKPLSIASLNAGKQVRVYPEPAVAPPPCVTRDPGQWADTRSLAGGGGLNSPALDPFLFKLLLGVIRSMGYFEQTPVTAADLDQKTFFADHYDRWFKESLAVLLANDYLHRNQAGGIAIAGELPPLSALWQAWDARKEQWLSEPDQRAQVKLVTACLRALPDILHGKTPATAVLFPASSMDRVEGIYRGNRVSDYYNQVLSDILVGHIRQRLDGEPGARISILEVGAGTGGTTATLLPALRPFTDHIDQYCYTDLSRAFLLHAEKHFLPDHPYLRTRRFDVETPIAGQGIGAGEYDVVIGTNVLHATRNIRSTLQNVKAALGRQGLLLLNEISDRSLFTHLTFGLLSGWWRYEDPQLRIPGCPGLYPATWEKVLSAAGFHSVQFPVEQAHGFGQQLVVAHSDGIVLEEIDAAPVTRPPVKPVAAVTKSNSVTGESLVEKSTRYFKKLVASALKMSVHEIDSSLPLEHYGIDSILVVQLTNLLEEVFENVPSTLFFEVQTIDALVAHFMEHRQPALCRVVGGDDPGKTQESGAPPAIETTADAGPGNLSMPRSPGVEPPALVSRPQRPQPSPAVAVIGLSGRYPQADNMGEFWQALKTGKNCITPIPEDRWDWAGYYDAQRGREGHIYTRWGGFMSDVDMFDPLFFRITPGEAEKMDPQERLFLETAHAGIEDAGYTPAGLCESRKIGVFVGVMNGTYRHQPRHWSIANRVSYVMNFQGPSLAIDTACSSSLTAIHLALESLAGGTCEIAIAGGVSLILHPAHVVNLSEMMMLSATDQCKAFGANADGFVDGEGVGAVVLKPLDRAIRDKDHIYGILTGSMINAGGKTNGYMVPNPHAQHRLIADTLSRAGVHARTISYVEAHGTGTALGDPIEIAGLTRGFARDSKEKQFCAIGSVKSNIGHCESAAGIAGLTKVLLQLQHGKLVPSLHSAALNPKIDFDNTPFVVQQELADWERPRLALDNEVEESAREYPRRAAVSSFGAGGANAHVLVEEYAGPPAEDVPHLPAGPYVIVLSARDDDRLRKVVENLIQFLRPSPVNLSRLAYTLQVGREAMEERLGLLVTSQAELVETLDGVLAGRDDAAGVYRGRAGSHRSALSVFTADDDLAHAMDAWIQKGKYHKLLDLWVKGLAIDWRALYGETRPQRMSLPTYPFARERYWAPEMGEKRPEEGVRDREERLEDRGGTARTCPAAAELKTGASLVMSRPVWREAAAGETPDAPEYEQHHVLCCGLENIVPETMASRLTAGRCRCLQSEKPDLAARFTDMATQVFCALKQIMSGKSTGRILVQVLISSRGAGRIFSGLSGLLKTAHLENPRIVGQLIAVDPDAFDPIETRSRVNGNGVREILMENSRCPADGHIRYIDGRRQVRSWGAVPVPGGEPAVPWRDQGVYLITGGAGGLGMLFAEEIARTTRNATVVLAGRSPLSRETEDRLTAMGAAGVRIDYRRVHVQALPEVRELVTGIERAHGPVTGILHAAGVHHDNFMIKKSAEEFGSVLLPKVSGTVALDQATRGCPLDFFILFSSIAGAMGNPGQADYAVANAFMDAYAAYRNNRAAARKLPGRTLAINWPLWRDGGMAVDSETQTTMRRQMGMVAMDRATGVRALSRAMTAGRDQILVMAGNRARIWQWLGADGAWVDRPPVEKTVTPGDRNRLKKQTLAQLTQLFGETTKLPPARIEPLMPLEAYGIDSILITRLNRKLASVFGAISKTLFFEYQTLAALAGHLVDAYPAACAQWAGAPAAASTACLPASPREVNHARPHAARTAGAREPVAIIGISGHYAQADTLDEYWDNLKAGKDCITEIPEHRWPLDGFFHPDPQEAAARGRSYSKWGSFLDDFDRFDPLFFNISPREAPVLDPHERLFLQAAWETLEDAGYTREMLLKDYHQQVGVFAGITKTGFYLHGPALWQQGKFVHPHTSFASVANRVSYFLNLRGPSMPIDTMCSSSLTAIHEACEHLHRGECELALAGGVNLYLHPATYVWMCAQRMLSRGRRCKSFGRGSDGFVPGEGVGVVLLKPLSRAVSDRDHIYALIRATHVNHDGKTNGYTVPNPRAQGELIGHTLAKAGVHARTVSYVEAHGTGTRLGDPIEITGLSQGFQKDTADTGFCALGSVKSNLGHLEAAAGMAGLTKVVLQMKHRKLAPSLHAQELNPNIDFDRTPFVVQQKLGEWKRPRITRAGGTREYPRRASISSFGAGGTNAHALIEEYVADGAPERAIRSGPFLIVLSAKNQARLAAYVAKLLAFIRKKACVDAPAAGHTADRAILQEKIRRRLAVILQVDETDIEADEMFSDYGVEPRHQARLLEVLQEECSLKADAREFMAQPTLAAVTDVVMRQQSDRPSSARPSSDRPSDESGPVVETAAIGLADVAYTLQVGREAMAQRLGLIVQSIGELAEKLTALMDGKDDFDGLYRGRVSSGQEAFIHDADDAARPGPPAGTISSWIRDGHFGKILAHWVQGGHIDWPRLHGKDTPRRISLPTYPFARDRFWPAEPPSPPRGTPEPPRDPAKTALPALSMMIPVWDRVSTPDKPAFFPEATDPVFIVGGSREQITAIRDHYPQARPLTVDAADAIDVLAEKMTASGPLAHLIWIVPPGSQGRPGDEAMIREQALGVVWGFRMIKALLSLGYGAQPFAWTVVTTRTLAVRKQDAMDATHAGIHGLMGALAKEYPQWHIRLIDGDQYGKWPGRDLFTLPADDRGDAWAYRGHEWFRQSLVPLESIPGDAPPYREQGVYVVIGGAGGIGEVWSRFMIEKYRARVVWVGRRPKDARIQAKIDRLAQFGPGPPRYIQADAANPVALERAWAQIKTIHPRIHGVVHSAIVLRDGSLAHMDEDQFRAALAAKVDVSVALARVIRQEPVELVLFFSALQSFVKAPGQSNYAAGCTFKDALAHQLSREFPGAVKIVNWGYWGRVGVVASPFYRDRMAARGIGSIGPEAGMAALENFLQGPLKQAVLVKWLEN